MSDSVVQEAKINDVRLWLCRAKMMADPGGTTETCEVEDRLYRRVCPFQINDLPLLLHMKDTLSRVGIRR